MENIETLLAAVAQTQGFDDDEPAVPTAPDLGLENSASSPPIQLETGDSQLMGAQLEVSADARTYAAVNPLPPPPPVVGTGDRRKRGRPARGQMLAKPPPPKRKKQEDEEEDVCFICFDGGSLVLCDRKSCPKAYHPACIKRDAAFFESKAKWYCGWHICTSCRKASHFVCYTCTYSLCKGCTKDADYLCVRGNKGFCSTCMKTIMLIENKGHPSNEPVQVDFDDKSSWEYLFKVYWVFLKEKLSLTLSELVHAQKPWKPVAAVACKPQLSSTRHTAVDGRASISCNSTKFLELNELHGEMSLPQNGTVKKAESSSENDMNRTNNNTLEDEPSNIKDIGKPFVDKGNDGKVSSSFGSTENLELNEPHLETNLPQNDVLSKTPSLIDNHVDKQGSKKGDNGPSDEKYAKRSIVDRVANEPVIKEAINKPGIEKDTGNFICKDIYRPSIGENTDADDLDKPGTGNNCEWASKELLEFVAHMRNGDTSALPHFDVQTLLLDYIKRNNLRDPSRKSQIICDLRLKNLFGKPRVGHIEMLKLLEYHFVIKEDSQKNSFIPAGFVGSGSGDMEVEVKDNGLSTPSNNRKRKTRKKSEDKASQNNSNEYAAIDVHNINLIYLKRNLMENLIGDQENFSNKVIGSIVRIRISTNDQKQDVYRLVQVVGTSKVAEPYKVGDRTADVMLEVLNLDKKEIVSIDAISNQDFTEDECKRLRQSIRCGLVKQFTVGEVLKKAMRLQLVRLNDWLEAEILRLNHLRDRASEKGHKKELRKYVQKIELLKSPEERQRRISEVPHIHADPKMSPNYESEEDTRSGDNGEVARPICSGFSRNGRKPNSPCTKGKEDVPNQLQNRMIDRSGSHSSGQPTYQVYITNTYTGGRNDQRSEETPRVTASMGNSPSGYDIESEKLWHYRDPNGKIQGAFSIMQLRKWSTTGLFPPDMRIWTNHEQYDSLLLADALNGQFHFASQLSYKPSSGSQGHRVAGGTEDLSSTGGDSKQAEAVWCRNADVLMEVETGSSSWPQCWDLLKSYNSSVDDIRERSLIPASRLQKTNESDDELKNGSENGEKNSSGLAQNHDLQKQCNNQDQAGLSTEENVRSLHIDLRSNNVEVGSAFACVSVGTDSSKREGNIDFLDLPSPTPGTRNENSEVQTAEYQLSVSSDVPIQNSVFLELLSPAPRTKDEDQEEVATEAKLMNFSVPNTGQSWNASDDLVVGSAQLPEVADEWCGYSPTPAKASEVTSENFAPFVSNSHQLSHASPPSNLPNWLATSNEKIEFDALGEESVSDLLAQVEMESQGNFPSPTSAMKFARELMQDCKDDCFSSIEEFDTVKSDAFSSSTVASQSSMPCRPIGASPIDALNPFRSAVHFSASSEGESNAPVCSGEAGSEFHPPAANQDMVGVTMAPGSDAMDPGWGTVQGNINLVTVQGNVNLVLGGPSQGIANLGWGANPGTNWVNQNPINGSLTWDGHRKYGGERFTSPREWGYQAGDHGFGRGRPPWGRQPYCGGGGGYSRPLPKGQRVCKFYENGHCKKGAFCDYLHP